MRSWVDGFDQIYRVRKKVPLVLAVYRSTWIGGINGRCPRSPAAALKTSKQNTG